MYKKISKDTRWILWFESKSIENAVCTTSMWNAQVHKLRNPIEFAMVVLSAFKSLKMHLEL